MRLEGCNCPLHPPLALPLVTLPWLYPWSLLFLIVCWYSFSRHIFLQAQFMYYVLFYSFKYGPSPCDLLGKLRKCDLEGMDRFLSDLLHEPSPCMLPSGQGTLVAPQAHREGFEPKISTLKELSCSSWLWPKISARTHFCL